jgi:hypothetical protein
MPMTGSETHLQIYLVLQNTSPTFPYVAGYHTWKWILELKLYLPAPSPVAAEVKLRSL